MIKGVTDCVVEVDLNGILSCFEAILKQRPVGNSLR